MESSKTMEQKVRERLAGIEPGSIRPDLVGPNNPNRFGNEGGKTLTMHLDGYTNQINRLLDGQWTVHLDQGNERYGVPYRLRGREAGQPSEGPFHYDFLGVTRREAELSLRWIVTALQYCRGRGKDKDMGTR